MSWWRNLKKRVGLARHGRQKHLVICGCSRSGTTLLYNMVRASAGKRIHAPDRERRAVATVDAAHPFIVTKRPLDLLSIPQITETLGDERDLWFLACLRDPRSLVSSMHAAVPHQFFQGWDYQFFIKGSEKSFTNPGLADSFVELARLREEPDARVSFVKYEDLVRDPEALRGTLTKATGLPLDRPFSEFHTAPIPEALNIALNGVRPVEVPEAPSWTAPGRLERTRRQIALFPEIETVATDWGYPPFDEVLAKAGIAPTDIKGERGTIVAFHTDDPLYRAEAARFLKSVERLGLPVDLQVVPSRDDWVANCAMKPRIIADARRRLSGPLLYVDVDAVIHADPWPYLSLYDGDMAATIMANGTMASGTIWVGDTPGARTLIEAWARHQAANPKLWDQQSLRQVVDKSEAAADGAFRFQRLPHNLCYIFDRKYPRTYGPVLIEHLQASRESESKWGADATRRSRARKAKIAKLVKLPD